MTPQTGPVQKVGHSDVPLVCHISLGLSTGGLERLLVDFAKFGDPSRYRTVFVSIHDTGRPAEEIVAHGGQVHALRMQGQGRLSIARRLAGLFRELGVNVVHTHNAFPHMVGTAAARWAGIRAIVHTRHGQRFGHGWKSRWSFKLASWGARRIVAVSDDAARLCVAEDGLPRRKVVRIWNGIDCDRFAYRGPANAPVAISVARLSKEKDFPTLLRAVDLVRAKYPEFRLKIVGNGPEMDALRALRSELRLEEIVELAGERSDVPELLAQAGFFVTSSLTEGVSLTLLEAMAVGLPILATAVGGNPEVVDTGVTGRLVPSASPEKLAEGIEQMLAARSEWSLMGQAARERVLAHFDIRTMLANYQDLYDEVLTETGGARIRQSQPVLVTAGGA
jgi:glycosyltransferase involved in cell wall biosynthesis